MQDSPHVPYVKQVNTNLPTRKPLHVFHATLVNIKIVKGKPVAKIALVDNTIPPQG